MKLYITTVAVLLSLSSATAQTRESGLVTQTDRVVTKCFPANLRNAISKLQAIIGPIEITSGHRRSRGMHGRCQAVDFRPTKVSNREAIRVMRTMPEIGGIGTYKRKSILHMDVRSERYTWRH